MKYIKAYEAKERLTVGKYVICVDNTLDIDDEDERDAIVFLSTNIGKIVKKEYKNEAGIINDNDYCVFYENVPENISFLFSERFNNIPGSRWFNRNEILYFSSNKKELEIKILSKKYNL